MSIYKVYKDTDPAGKFNEILADEDFVKENYSSDGWSYEIVNPPVLSTEDQKNINKINARIWRDEELANTDNIAQTPDFPNRDKYLTYRQALRDWPSTSNFPDTRPTL